VLAVALLSAVAGLSERTASSGPPIHGVVVEALVVVEVGIQIVGDAAGGVIAQLPRTVAQRGGAS